MNRVTLLVRPSLVVGLLLVAVAASPSASLAGSAQFPADAERVTVAPDAVTVTVQVSVIVDEERAGSVRFTGLDSTADGIAVGRLAAAGEQTVAVVDQNGTEVDRGRTDRDDRVVLDSLVGVPFVVAVGGINGYSEDMVLTEGERQDLSVVTYVSQGNSAVSPASSPGPSAVSPSPLSVASAMPAEGDSASPSMSGSGVAGGIWSVLLLVRGTIFLVSLATHTTTRIQRYRR